MRSVFIAATAAAIDLRIRRRSFKVFTEEKLNILIVSFCRSGEKQDQSHLLNFILVETVILNIKQKKKRWTIAKKKCQTKMSREL